MANKGTQSHEPDDFNVISTASPSEIEDLDDALQELPESQQPGFKPKADPNKDPDDEGESDPAGQGAQHDPDDEDEDDDRQAKVDQELRDASSDEERQKIKDRNKQNRLNQRQRQKQRIEQLERQLQNAHSLNQEHAQRLSRLEGGQRGTELAGLQGRMQEAEQAETRLKAIIADATVKGDGATVAEATGQLLDVKQYRAALHGAAQQFEQESQRPQRAPLNPKIMEFAKGFMTKNSWYKGPASDDEDSQIMAVIDRKLVAEGWNPGSKAYWDELENRAAARLPHRFGQGGGGKSDDEGYNQPRQQPTGQQRQQRRSPVADGGSGSQPNGGGNSQQTMRLSADRVRAMKEAGMWDNPEKRKKMIAAYRAADLAASKT